MLKTLMHSSNAGNTRNDSNRSRPYEPPRVVEPVRIAETPKAETSPETSKSSSGKEGSKLIVGPNIKLKGSEITDCEILVVEGRVEASMKSRDILIAEGGVFSGKAEIDVAEVRGNFEGELTARKRLVIHATGKVTGTIRYGAMMVEEGGCVAGDVATLATGIAAKPASPAAQDEAGETTQEKSPVQDQIQAGSTYFRNQTGRR